MSFPSERLCKSAQLDGVKKSVGADACFSEEHLRPPCGSPATRCQAVKPQNFVPGLITASTFTARISQADDIEWSSPLNKVDAILYRPAETQSIALAASHRAPFLLQSCRSHKRQAVVRGWIKSGCWKVCELIHLFTAYHITTSAVPFAFHDSGLPVGFGAGFSNMVDLDIEPQIICVRDGVN